MVGPWGWAARMKREDLLIATAVLMGHSFDYWRWPKYGTEMRVYRPHVPKWLYAEQWLRDRGVEFTGLE